MIENWWCWCVCHHLVCVRGCNQSRQKVDEVVTRLVLCKSAQSCALQSEKGCSEFKKRDTFWIQIVQGHHIHRHSSHTPVHQRRLYVLQYMHCQYIPANVSNTPLCSVSGRHIPRSDPWISAATHLWRLQWQPAKPREITCVSYKKELSKNWGSIGDHSFPTKLPGASQDWTNVSPQFSWRHWSFYQRALRHFSKKK